LKRDGMVEVRKDGRVRLSVAGGRIAKRLAVRHHLIERMLTEIFGMPWYRTHDEAERLEHAVSAEFETLLIEKLGAGGACPHGNLATIESPAQKESEAPAAGRSGTWWRVRRGQRVRARLQPGGVAGSARHSPRK